MWCLLNQTIKRLFDILISAVALVALFPVWIVLAVAIKLDSDGPVIFAQERRTKNGRIFKMYKFRTMVVNAEKMESGLFSFANDPRVT